MSDNNYQENDCPREMRAVYGAQFKEKKGGVRRESTQKNHFKARRSRRLDWQIRQKLADAEIEAWKLRDQNREAFRVLQRELDCPSPHDVHEIWKEVSNG